MRRCFWSKASAPPLTKTWSSVLKWAPIKLPEWRALILLSLQHLQRGARWRWTRNLGWSPFPRKMGVRVIKIQSRMRGGGCLTERKSSGKNCMVFSDDCYKDLQTCLLLQGGLFRGRRKSLALPAFMAFSTWGRTNHGSVGRSGAIPLIRSKIP